MNILFVCNGLAGGGAEKLLSELLPIMKEQYKIRCDILILHNKNEKYIEYLQSKGISICVVPETCKTIICKYNYIWHYMVKGNYDLIHANLFPAFYFCSIIRILHRKTSPKMIMTEHSTDNHRRHIKILRPLEKIIYSSYEKNICISNKTKDNLIKWLKPGNKNHNKFIVINNGINIEKYVNAIGLERRILFPGIEDNDILICMIGSFREAKNHATLIKTMRRLPEKYKLVLAGEGPLELKIKKMTEEFNLEKRVVFLGYRSDIDRIIKTADVIVVPSKWEGFGLSAVESMASGKPVIVSEVEGLSEVVDDGAIKFKWDSDEEFASAILKLENNEIYEYYAGKARNRAKVFDIHIAANEYVKIYKDIISQKE